MKALISVILFHVSITCGTADDLASRHPLSKYVNDVNQIAIAGGGKLHLLQASDLTEVDFNGRAILTLEAPQFVKGLTVSEDRSVVALLINKDRSQGGLVFSDYHSVLRLRFDKDGVLIETDRLLEKTDEFMKPLYRWIVELDSILNDGRTARMKFGEQIDENDPTKEVHYSMQVRDLVTGKLYRDEGRILQDSTNG